MDKSTQIEQSSSLELLRNRFVTNPEEIFFAILILSGVALRFWGLSDHPVGIDIDEGFILFWGRRALSEHRWIAYSPEFTQWEMLPGYLYALLSGGALTPPRWIPSLLGLGEILLLGVWMNRQMGRRLAWLACAFLTWCPWHFYYSRILGTCTGMVGLVVLTLLFSPLGRPKALPLLMTGLLYYTTFRLLVAREFVVSLLQRRYAECLYLAGGVLGVLALVGLSESHWSQFFLRGGYNIPKSPHLLLGNLLGGIVFPYIPVLERFHHTTTEFMADYVHLGATLTLSGPPLGWGLSVLVMAGGARTLREVLRKGTASEAFSHLVFFAFLVLILGLLGPSLSRGLIFLPFLIYLGFFGIQSLSLQGKSFVVGAFLLLIPNMVQTVTLYEKMGDQRLLEPVFHSRHLKISKFIEREIPEPSQASVLVMTEFGQPAARYWRESSGKYSVFFNMPAKQFIKTIYGLSSYSPRGEQWVLWDKVPEEAERYSGYNKKEETRAMWDALKRQALIIDEGEIKVEGEVVGWWRKIQWSRGGPPR